MKILIYDRTFHCYSESVKYLIPVIQLLANKHDVSLLGDRAFNLERLATYYGTEITNAQFQHLDHRPFAIPFIAYKQHLNKTALIGKMSQPYDLFINNAAHDHWQVNPGAKKNIALIYAPSDPGGPFAKQEKYHTLKNYLRRKYYGNPAGHTFTDQYSSVLAPSDYAASWAKKLWQLKEVAVIPPWVDILRPASATEKKNSITARFSLCPDSLGDITAAIETCKRIVDTAHLSDWQLELALYSTDQSKESLISYMRKLNRVIRRYPIKLYLNLSDEKLRMLFAQARVFWNIKGISRGTKGAPWHFDSAGITTLEAMNAQCVPVLLNAGCLKTLAHNFRSGIFINNTNDLMDTTLLLSQKPDIVSEIAKNAYHASLAYSKERFTVQAGAYFDNLL